MSCFAYTALDPQYPPYMNIRVEDDHVIVAIRSAPKVFENRSYLCSYKTGPGRCQPGGPNCNNYCNMHPDKNLRMADRPLPCTQVLEGSYASCRIPVADWTAMGLPLPPA